LLDSRILRGDCVELMGALPTDSFDAIVTDPPYGLEFMGKEWDRLAPVDRARAEGKRRDHGTARVGGFERSGVRYVTDGEVMQRWHEAWAAEALRVLKPGGHLLAFGGSRTYHRLACAVEDVGFELRDSLMWIYAQGFPKSKDAGEGRGTALKPAYEPIVVARKPLVGNVAQNVARYGTGALNIDACRIPVADTKPYQRNHSGDRGHAGTRGREQEGATNMHVGGGSAAEGRFPANLLIDEVMAAMLDAQSGDRPGGGYPAERGDNSIFNKASGGNAGPRNMGDRGGASRFFFCSKVTRLERDLGLGGFDTKMLRWSSGDQSPGTFQSEGTEKSARNHHLTVKPIDLMRWLCRLVTPPGGLLLDPFLGSGSTGCGAAMEGLEFAGMEREADYIEIAEARIAHWSQYAGADTEAATRSALVQELAKEAGQLDLLVDREEPCHTGS
jgi:site-specific DNA-methyltransferase (adenine-specific)